MLSTLSINVLSERTLEFTLPTGGKFTAAAVLFAEAAYTNDVVGICFLCNGKRLYSAALGGLTLDGASFDTAQEAVIALNAVIGAAFRSAGGTAQTTPPVIDYNDLENKPNLADVATSGDFNDLTNLPAIADVAITGSYNDLENKPALADVATTGSYNDLTDKPVIVIPNSQINLASDESDRYFAMADIVMSPTLSWAQYMGSFEFAYRNFGGTENGTEPRDQSVIGKATFINNTFTAAANGVGVPSAGQFLNIGVTITAVDDVTTYRIWYHRMGSSGFNTGLCVIFNVLAVADWITSGQSTAQVVYHNGSTAQEARPADYIALQIPPLPDENGEA